MGMSTDTMGNENEGNLIIDASGTTKKVSLVEPTPQGEKRITRTLVDEAVVAGALGGGLMAEIADAIQDEAKRRQVLRQVEGQSGRYKDDKFADLAYGELRTVLTTGRLKRETLSPEEMGAVRESRRLRYEEAAAYGVMTNVDGILKEELTAADWTDYPARIAVAARRAETDAIGVLAYAHNSRIRGVVSDAVGATELLVRRDGLEQLADLTVPKNQQKLRELKITDVRTEVAVTQKKIDEEVLWDPIRNYAALVDLETPRQKEEKIAKDEAEKQRRHELELAQAQAETVARAQQPPAQAGYSSTDLKEMFGTGAKYEDFIRRILKQDGAHTNWTDFPPPWYKNLPDDLKSQAEFYESLANGSYVKKKYGQVKLEAVQNNEALSALDKRELMLFYESPGGREALERMMKRYFEFQDDKYGNRWIRLKGYNSHMNGDDALYEITKKGITDAKTIDDFKKELWRSLQTHEDIIREAERMGLGREEGPEIVARGKVANAWNFLYISHIVESADIDRDLAPGSPSYVEQVRANFHPLAKIKVKLITDSAIDKGKIPGVAREAWGGGVGAWLVEHGTNSELRRQVYEGKIRPYPKILFASMIELVGWHEGGDKKAEFTSLAEALLNKREIKKEDWTYIEGQELIGQYNDWWSAAGKVYEYATGGEKTQAGRPEQWRNWGVDLANAWAKLRGLDVNIAPYMSDEEALFWTIVNSLLIDQKKLNLNISKTAYPQLDITIKAMLSDRLMYVADSSDGKVKRDPDLVRKINKRIGADFLRAVSGF